jgi:hypothetical protein
MLFPRRTILKAAPFVLAAPYILRPTPAQAALAISGTPVYNQTNAASMSWSLTTTTFPGVLVVLVLNDGGSDATSITHAVSGVSAFTMRQSLTLGSNAIYVLNTWVATYTNAFSTQSFTVNLSSSHLIDGVIFAVSGDNGASPIGNRFDPNAPTGSNSAAATLTTSFAHNLVFANCQLNGAGWTGGQAPWQAIVPGSTSGFVATIYQIVSAAGPYTPQISIGSGLSIVDSTVDAITADTPTGNCADGRCGSLNLTGVGQ